MTYPRLSLIAPLVSFATHADADILSRWVHHKVTSAALACCKCQPPEWPRRVNSVPIMLMMISTVAGLCQCSRSTGFEATLRYTDVRTRLYNANPGFSGDQTYKDKGMDVKVRLLEESTWIPNLSGFS